MSSALIEWCCSELSKLLGFPATEDFARYILNIENQNDLEEYLSDILDPTISSHKCFIKELLLQWKQGRNKDSPSQVKVYMKPDTGEDYVKGEKKCKSSKKKGLLEKNSNNQSLENDTPSKAIHLETSPEPQSLKKKKKFVSLYSKEGQLKDIIILPGRHPCQCEASKHKLVNNCLKCGRIVCEQEGSGPCFTCGSLVCSKEEQEIIQRGSRKSEKLLQKLMGESYDGQDKAVQKSGYDAAVEQKNRLLEYDKNSEKRTRVIDDESDYFAVESNKWLTKEERAKMSQKQKELHARRHVSRLNQKITLDFAGRRVLEQSDEVDFQKEIDDEFVQAANFSSRICEEDRISDSMNNLNVDPHISVSPPVYEDSGSHVFHIKENSKRQQTNFNSLKKNLRIQDRELQEMSDDGKCLSMHQPWASLLIMGIKKHEGRTWYTPYRGRLWIHSASKVPSHQEITETEQIYRILECDDFIKFPEQYPTGCLLGCVDLTECLPQEQYREQYPDGESGSPYVFICENPQELLVKFPMKGKHKIFQLDSRIHEAAKKTLRKPTSHKG
ncbi:activating signal cointegrator 1-like [Limulus polyphemus]|uniref:Activating signal cointegrator 1-like n=1 Tax=Limulus polyphemus TaxID=6850 RepID=A0ABM1B862_LIMPO|nr:activating signal cointegrator 1-like [Limulus polyphemus]